MNFAQLSSNITDLPGVEGLCLLDLQGTLLFRRMPSFIPESCYDEAVRRIVGLYGTVDENFLPADDYSLRFSEKWLVLRRTGNLILVVLTSATANLSPLRMVSNLALRQLQSSPAMIAELQAGAGAPTAPAPAPASPHPAAASPAGAMTPAPAAPSTPAAPAAASSANAPVEPAPPPARAKPVRMYRGQPIID